MRQSDIKKFSAQSPAKIILSGEHSVLLGAPAIATAIQKFCTTEIITQGTKSHDIEINIHSLGKPFIISTSGRQSITRKLERLHQESPHHHAISAVEFIAYAIEVFFNRFDIHLNNRLQITLSSNIKIGAGLGSSAACLTSLLSALYRVFDIPIETETLIPLAIQCENLQHGQSSGLDIKTSFYGDCHLFTHETIEPILTDFSSFHIIDTGTPQSNTAQCTKQTLSILRQDKPLLDAFCNITHAFKQQLLASKPAEKLIDVVKENHRLLQQLNVIQEPVLQYISEIEANQGAAKISGAGNIMGPHCGAVWALGDPDMLKAISKKFGFTVSTIERCEHGTIPH